MISKEQLKKTAQLITEDHFCPNKVLSHIESWGSIFQIEIYRLHKSTKLLNREDFIINSWKQLDEGNFCENTEELLNLIDLCEPTLSTYNIKADVDRVTQKRLAWFWDDLKAVDYAVTLLKHWNNHYFYLETEQEQVGIWVHIPE